MTYRRPEMTEDSRDRELGEVLSDAAQEYYHALTGYRGGLRRAFTQYANDMVRMPLAPNETLEQRFLTALMLAFMAGREHKARGYASPVPKDQPVDEIDDGIAEMSERMNDPD